MAITHGVCSACRFEGPLIDGLCVGSVDCIYRQNEVTWGDQYVQQAKDLYARLVSTNSNATSQQKHADIAFIARNIKRIEEESRGL